MKEANHKRAYTLWFHLYEGLGEVRSTHRDNKIVGVRNRERQGITLQEVAGKDTQHSAFDLHTYTTTCRNINSSNVLLTDWIKMRPRIQEFLAFVNLTQSALWHGWWDCTWSLVNKDPVSRHCRLQPWHVSCQCRPWVQWRAKGF